MTESKSIQRFSDHRDNARAIHDYLDAITAENKIFDDPFLEAMYSDVSGLLAGIAQGTIRSGQPRIVEQLIRIAQNYPDGLDATPVIEAVAACSECGLSAISHVFPGTLRTTNVPER